MTHAVNRRETTASSRSDPAEIHPLDEHNRALLRQVHPPDWVNPAPADRYNLVVIGAGAGGLVSSIGSAMVGAKVALVEKAMLGGDCLTVGCVPSKALLRCARAYADVRDASEFGVRVPDGVRVDFPEVMQRMRRLRASISPNDGVDRLRAADVDLFLGHGQFVAPDCLEVSGQRLRFSRAIIATGGRPADVSIPGLSNVGYLTNETVFWITELPRRIAVIGAGPIGCELSQAFARFGADVHLLDHNPRILKRDDSDASDIVAQALARDGVRVRCLCNIKEVRREADAKVLGMQCDGRIEELQVDEILVSAGRRPNVENLGLEAAGVQYDRTGIVINDRLQTTNRRIYAVGDVCFKHKFTHVSDAMARIAIRNALFFGRAKASALTIPWCTYTDPELAHVGLSQTEAAERGYDVQTTTVPLAHVDRAILDGEDHGLLKVHHLKNGRILGATLVARHAGEMISQITAMMVARVKLGTLANVIHPYPTQAEVIRKAADKFALSRLTPRVRSILRTLLSWRR